jgi:hypothetical protein
MLRRKMIERDTMRCRGLCLAVFAAGAIVAACSSSSSPAQNGPYQGSYEGYEGYPTAAPTAMPYPGDGEPMPTAAPTAVPAMGGQTSDGSIPTSAVPGPEDQIIKTGTITIQVAGLDQSIVRATDQIHGLGGWLAGSDRTVSTAEEIASVTYRVPANRFEDALAAMRVLGTKVLGEHTDSTPVGGVIVDLQARIENLRASEKAIQAIMSKAKTIGDVLTVEQRLAEVQGQIEQLSAQLASLSDRAAYSTLTVVFEVPILPTPTPSPTPTPTPSPTATPIPWSAGDQAGQAAGALGEVGKAAATVLIWFAILVLPIGLALLAALLVLLALARLTDPLLRRLVPRSARSAETNIPGRPQA